MRSNVDLAAAEGEIAETAILAGLTDALVQTRRAVAILQALEARVLAAGVALAVEQASRRRSPDRDIPIRTVAAEFAAAIRVSDRTVQRQLSEASVLVDRFPATLAALSEGCISRGHVAVIVEAGSFIGDPAARAGYEAAAVRVAEGETPARLRPIARALAERAHPRPLDERHRAARRERFVEVRDLDDGMAELFATLPAMLAHGIHDRLTRMAHVVRSAMPPASQTPRQQASDASEDTSTLRTADAGRPDVDEAAPGGAEREGAGDDPPGAPSSAHGEDAAGGAHRTMDELRADVLCDLLLGGAPVAHGEGLDAITAEVQLTVPALTLLGHGHEAPLLPGYGPIDVGTARHLTARAPGWDRVLTDPFTGNVLAVDRYRPSQELRRFLRVRDEACRFPGCRMPAARCDVDHSRDHAQGGQTRESNLAHMCRRHHVLKHATDWVVEQLGDGRLRWTSPTGRTYIDVPAPVLRFTPEPDPPPGLTLAASAGDPPPF